MCKEGYEEINGTCLDKDECTLIPGLCSPHGTCENTPGSFACNCDLGFKQDGVDCNGMPLACHFCKLLMS